MNRKVRAILFAVLGIILLGLGIFAVIRLYQQSIPEMLVGTEIIETDTSVEVDVVVTTRDLFLGDLIAEDDITTISMPAEFVPRDSISTIEEVTNKIIKTDMVQGEMVLQHNLADPTNINHDLAFILNEDHVLFAFPANDLMSSNSIIQRGDIVDILATIRVEVGNIGSINGEENQAPVDETDEKAPESTVLTLDAYQAVEVTALVADIVEVEQDAEVKPDAPPQREQINVRTYLLALPPQDALLLKHLIDTDAKFDMVLRAPTSRGEFELIPVTKEYIVELYGLGIVP